MSLDIVAMTLSMVTKVLFHSWTMNIFFAYIINISYNYFFHVLHPTISNDDTLILLQDFKLKEMFPLYYIDSDIISRFKSTTTHWGEIVMPTMTIETILSSSRAGNTPLCGRRLTPDKD